MLEKWFAKCILVRLPLMLEQLEERVVYDAAVAATSDVHQDNSQASTDTGQTPHSGTQPTDTATTKTGDTTAPDKADTSAATATQTDQASTTSGNASTTSGAGSTTTDLKVVVVANSLENIQALTGAADQDAKVILYDAANGDLKSLTQALDELVQSEGAKIDQLAVLSHGNAGVFSLGGSELWTSTTIQESSAQWLVLATLLDADSRIDLYGCSIGAGEEGKLLVDTLAEVTGAVVWASDDPTGNVEGADWVFEVKSADDARACLIDASSLASTPVVLADLGGTEGPDTLTVNAGESYECVNALGGDDTITNYGTVTNLIVGGEGVDTIYNYGIAGDIRTGTGFSANYGGRTENWGTAVSLIGDDGSDTIIVHQGTVESISGDQSGVGCGSADTIIVEAGATVTRDLWGDGGNDTVDVSGTVGELIWTNDGDDTFILRAGQCYQVFLGEGDDKAYVLGGSVSDSIEGDAGTDTIYLSYNCAAISRRPGEDIGNCRLDGKPIVWHNIETVAVVGTSGDDAFTARGTDHSAYIDLVYGLGDGDWITIDDASKWGTFGSVWGDDGDSSTADGNEIITVKSGALITTAYGQDGSVHGEGGNDLIKLSGTVEGNVLGEDGDDTVYLMAGTVEGSILGGDGNDTLALSYQCTNVTGDASSGSCTLSGKTISWSGFEHLGIILTESGDTTTVNLAAYGSHIEFLYGMGGSENLTLTGDGSGVSVYGDDNNPATEDVQDWITVRSGAQVLNVYGEGSWDTITNNGTVHANIEGGEGNDRITNNSVVLGSISGGDGDDTLSNTDSVNGDIDGGAGNDQITNEGTVTGNILGGAGNDTITNKGTVNGDMDGGAGNDQITNEGTVTGNILGGAGNDTITNKGTVNSDIDGGAGNDQITNEGTVTGDILCGDGDDTVSFKDGAVGGTIIGGSGSDTLRLTYECTNITGDASSGSCTYEGNSISWSGFEHLNLVFTEGNDTAVVDLGTGASGVYGIEALGGNDNVTLQGIGPSADVYGDNGSSADGADTISVEAGAQYAHVYGQGANDSISNAGTVTELNGGAGNDTISNTGSVTERIYGGAGDDQITVNGTVGTGIDAGSGADSVYLLGGAVSGTVSGGADSDTLYLTYRCTDITGNAASGSCTLDGHTVSWTSFEKLAINGTDGDDDIALNLTGATIDYVYGEDGNDRITISGNGTVGTVYGDDNSGGTPDGNDTVTIGAGVNVSTVKGEGGSDTLELNHETSQIQGTGASGTGRVGADTVTWDGFEKLGVIGTDGDDTFSVKLMTAGTSLDYVYGMGGNDTITMSGNGIFGSVLGDDNDAGTPDGNDTITIQAGARVNDLAGGDGDDTLNLPFQSSEIAGNSSTGQCTVSGNTTKWERFETLAVFGTDGNDVFTVQVSAAGADIDAVYGFGGNDDITIPGAGTFGNVFGDDNDASTPDGNDTITVLAGGQVNNVYGTGGMDTIVNRGSVAQDMLGGLGDDDLTNEGTVSGNIDAGAGNDAIRNEGTVAGSIDGGDGDDTIDVVAGAQAGSLLGAAGLDTITNGGSVQHDILGGSGNDTISNEGTVGGNVEGGDGDDRVYLLGGSVDGRVLGGDETDTLFLACLSANIWGDSADGGSDEVHGGWGEFETLGVQGTDGDDCFTVGVDETKEATIDLVFGLGGNDSITIPVTGTFGNVYGDDNDGATPDGDDTIHISAHAHVNNVLGEGGNDTISNEGIVAGDVQAGDGEDSVTIEYGGKVGGTIYGGAPDTDPGDTLTIHVSASSNRTGDASNGSLQDQDGDTLRWDGFEHMSVVYPPGENGGNGSSPSAQPENLGEAVALPLFRAFDYEPLTLTSEPTDPFSSRWWTTFPPAWLGPFAWEATGMPFLGHAVTGLHGGQGLSGGGSLSFSGGVALESSDTGLTGNTFDLTTEMWEKSSRRHMWQLLFGLDDFFDAVNRGLDGACLAFNADDIGIAELLRLMTATDDSWFRGDVPTGLAVDFAEGKSRSFDLGRLRVADMFKS
ncbi:MAG: DUF4347 domain-containing protein [Thermodesulfobacteriota bacterium]